jgi:hypothetical protein
MSDIVKKAIPLGPTWQYRGWPVFLGATEAQHFKAALMLLLAPSSPNQFSGRQPKLLGREAAVWLLWSDTELDWFSLGSPPRQPG